MLSSKVVGWSTAGGFLSRDVESLTFGGIEGHTVLGGPFRRSKAFDEWLEVGTFFEKLL